MLKEDNKLKVGTNPSRSWFLSFDAKKSYSFIDHEYNGESSLSRKAMKKTLKRLRREMIEDMNTYLKAREELDKAPTKAKTINFVFRANNALVSLISYIQTLEDAYSEFAEPFDKKLKKMEKAIENIGKPAQKEEERKKPSYRV